MEVNDEFVLLTICAQLCACRKIHTHTCMCIASICMSDICTITDMLIVPFVTRCVNFFYLHLCASDDTDIKFSPNMEGVKVIHTQNNSFKVVSK